MKLLLSLLASVFFILMIRNLSGHVESASSKYELTYLPLYNGRMTSKQYTGFVDIPTGQQPAKKLFYWFVTSKRNPAKDPGMFCL